MRVLRPLSYLAEDQQGTHFLEGGGGGRHKFRKPPIFIALRLFRLARRQLRSKDQAGKEPKCHKYGPGSVASLGSGPRVLGSWLGLSVLWGLKGPGRNRMLTHGAEV